MRKNVKNTKFLQIVLSFVFCALLFVCGINILHATSNSNLANNNLVFADYPDSSQIVIANGKTFRYEIIDSENHYVALYKNAGGDDNDPNMTGNITIPSSVTVLSTEYTVTTLGYSAFYLCEGITSVTIPDCVTEICGWAFSHCESLSQLTLPSHVTDIGCGAFDYCCFEYLEIPDSVTSIGGHAFGGNMSLKTVVLSNQWQESEEDECFHADNIFYSCDNLLEIYVGSNCQDYNLMESDDETVMQFYAIESVTASGYELELDGNDDPIVYTKLVAGKHLVRKEAVDNGDIYVVTLNCDTALASSDSNLLWTKKGNSGNDAKTAYKVVVDGGYYGPLPQGADGEPISWKNGNSRVKANNIVDLSDDVTLIGTYSTFPNTGVGVDIILPSAIILTLTISIVFVAFGGKKRKIIVK